MVTKKGSTVLSVVMVAGVLAINTACKEPPPPPPPPPPEVYIADVIERDVPVYVELVGQTVGYQDVEVRARIEGVLETMNFREGTVVRKGQLLYEIDRKPLEASLAAARASQSTNEARLEKTDNDVRRYTPLAAKQAVSQQELDNARAAQNAARSEVDAAKAAVDKASLDLGYTKVYSPIDGLVGTSLLKPGNLVGRGENTLLTVISQIDPILFRAGVTEADYLKIAQRAAAKGGPGEGATGIQLTLSDGSIYPHTGKVDTVDRAIDPTTGTLGVQFLFANPGQLLRPGQFGRARILLDTKGKALLVPQRAVQELQNLYSVAVVGTDSKVSFRNVKVGERVDNLWVIEDGLKPGDKIVVEGLQRIQEGATVNAKPAPVEGAPAAAPAAAPPAHGEAK